MMKVSKSLLYLYVLLLFLLGCQSDSGSIDSRLDKTNDAISSQKIDYRITTSTISKIEYDSIFLFNYFYQIQYDKITKKENPSILTRFTQISISEKSKIKEHDLELIFSVTDKKSYFKSTDKDISHEITIHCTEIGEDSTKTSFILTFSIFNLYCSKVNKELLLVLEEFPLHKGKRNQFLIAGNHILISLEIIENKLQFNSAVKIDKSIFDDSGKIKVLDYFKEHQNHTKLKPQKQP